MNSIAYMENGEFEVVDSALATLAAGGLHVQFGIGGNQRINNGCVADNKNNTCVQPNGLCAADTVCAEFI